MRPRRVEFGLGVWLLFSAVVSAQELTPGSPDMLRAALRAKVTAIFLRAYPRTMSPLPWQVVQLLSALFSGGLGQALRGSYLD